MKTEVLFLSRGGQGAVLASRILAVASVREGLYAQAIPEFGAERRGAIVRTYIRVSDRPIKTHEMVRRPDIVVVFSRGILDVLGPEALPERDATYIVNTRSPMKIGSRTYIVDATGIALRLGIVVAGWPVVNTAMLGSIARATGLYRLETLIDTMREFFEGGVLERNIEAARIAFEETREVS